MYFSTPICPLFCETGLVSALVLLDHQQKVYTHQLFCLLDSHPIKKILFISLREGDKGFQQEKLPENTLIWTQNARPTLYR